MNTNALIRVKPLMKKGMVLQTHNLTPFFRKLIVSTTWLKKITYQPLRQCFKTYTEPKILNFKQRW